MTIKSFVGGHSIKIFTDCVFDKSIRKYRKGRLATEVPYSGRMLSTVIKQWDTEPISYNGYLIPIKTCQIFESVDPIPDIDECDYCIVSSLYVAACKSLGIDTSRLLTIGDPVVDDEGYVIGTISLNRN